MNRLFVFYDRDCGLCARVKAWMETQPQLVPVTFIAYQNPEALRLCPTLPSLDPGREIVALADNGDVYTGGSAWITCLYALEKYRRWSKRLARPALLPLAKRACFLISENRLGISQMLSLKSDTSLATVISGDR